MEPAFWTGRRVFVTGHTGFKGGWLSLWLSKLNALVAGYALAPPTSPSLFEVAGIKDTLFDIRGDINDFEGLSAQMRRFEPEVIFHLAAQPLVRFSYEHPLETFQTNIMGTANLLQAVRRTPTVRAVVIITTDKCYENRDWIWGYRETDALGGYDPYSSSKAAAELITASYRDSFFHKDRFSDHHVSIATARAGNVLGGGDWATDRLIPDLLRSIVAGQPLVLRNPDSIRPWQHVLEPLCGYMLLARKMIERGPDYGDSWNFGPNESETVSVMEIVTKLKRELGSLVSVKVDESRQLHEANVLRLDTSKARAKIGWRPALSIDETISWIAEWELRHQEGKDMRAITCQQIDRYQALLGDRFQ